MLDGVAWAAGEIIVFMLASLLVGFAIGWILGRWLQKGSLLKGFNKQLAAERERTRKVEARLNDSRTTLDQAQHDLEGGAGQLEQLEEELETARTTVADLEAKLTALPQQDAEIERLAAELAAREDLEAKLAEVAGKDAELGELAEQLERCGSERDRLASDLASVEAAIADRDARIGELEAKLTDTADRPGAPPIPTAAEPEEPTKDEAVAQMAEIAARTAGGGPAPDDDLKKVRGIGPKLEGTLKRLGITSFRQIANFTAEDIAVVTAALEAFKGRIERDDWMTGAAEEHLKKYNEPA